MLIGLAIVAGIGFLYLFIANPDSKSGAPTGDAIEIAALLRAHNQASKEPTAP